MSSSSSASAAAAAAAAFNLCGAGLGTSSCPSPLVASFPFALQASTAPAARDRDRDMKPSPGALASMREQSLALVGGCSEQPPIALFTPPPASLLQLQQPSLPSLSAASFVLGGSGAANGTGLRAMGGGGQAQSVAAQWIHVGAHNTALSSPGASTLHTST